MAAKCVTLAVLLGVTLAASVVVTLEFLDDSDWDYETNSRKPSLPKIGSLIAWFFAWEVGLVMLLHVCVTCLSNEARGYLPTVSAVILYCASSFMFFWATFALSAVHGHPSHANTTISSSNTTTKVEIEDTLRLRYIYHSGFMLAAVIGFSVYSLILCTLMFVPRRGVQSNPKSKKKHIVKIGGETISTIAKELGRKMDNTQEVQLQA